MKRNKLIVAFLSTAAMTFSLASCGQIPRVPVHVESVELNLHQKDVFVGDSFDLTYVINPENADNKNVTWTSTAPEVVSVDDGHVLALQAGTATVSVITEDGNKRDGCVVNVGKHVENVTLREHEKFVALNDEFTVNYSIIPSDAADRRVQWSSDDISVATVDGRTIKAVGVGQATITILTVDGARSDTVLVHVAETQPKIVLDKDSVIETADNGVINQIKVENQVFDLVGLEEDSNSLGKFKKAAYNSYIYNGMIYNRSLFKGLKSIIVDYSGDADHFFIVWSDFLMENMDFNGEKVGNGVEIPANGKTYFILYNDGSLFVTINSITLKYDADDATDLKMIYDKNDDLGYARSGSKTTTKYDSYVELENNPTINNNNYSVGKNGDLNKSWYRWNGRYFPQSENLGTDFTIAMTLGVEYDRMIDDNKNFHINVWPQFTFGETAQEQSDNGEYEMIYIGSDNYEPLGRDNALHPDDPYVAESYVGKFFTIYEPNEWRLWSNNLNQDYKADGVVKKFATREAARDFVKALPQDQQLDWRAYAYGSTFLDPGETTLPGSESTLRGAYNAYRLPFWFVKFHVYLQENDISETVPYVDVYINGFKIFTDEIFYEYDTVNNPAVSIHTMPMHLVNYGIDAEGNPDDSYTGIFTYPRLVA